MKIFHHNDLDGRCAGAIAYKWSQFDSSSRCAEIIELDYKDPIDVDVISFGEKIILVDFSFFPEIMNLVLEITKDVIWIDHHKTAASYPYQHLSGSRDFTDYGFSGCELAWMYFVNSQIPKTVLLIGDYDSWRLKYIPETFQFIEGLKLHDTKPRSDIWDKLLFASVSDADFENMILEQGRYAIRYRDNYCEKICHDFGYEADWEGHKAFVANLYQFGSLAFGSKMEEYDFCVAYIHDGSKFTVSLYSNKIDVSEICKKYGGGGHRGSAGFICQRLPWVA